MMIKLVRGGNKKESLVGLWEAVLLFRGCCGLRKGHLTVFSLMLLSCLSAEDVCPVIDDEIYYATFLSR